MKKIIGVAAFAVLGMVALSSCKKDYTCISNGTEVGTCISCNKAAKTSFESQCAILGGTVSEK